MKSAEEKNPQSLLHFSTIVRKLSLYVHSVGLRKDGTFFSRMMELLQKIKTMMLHIRKSSGLIVLSIVLIAAFGCQSKKKAMQASNAAAEKARIEREQTENKQKAEALALQEAQEKSRHEEEERAKENESKASAPAVKLDQYFSAITNASNITSANTSINEALALFVSPSTPVLIVISDSNGIKDYDKPTTIKDYLNYLKDQKKNINSISDVKTDTTGKITTLELRKN